VAIVVALAPAVVGAQNDPLVTARELYASAAYEQALSTLARIDNQSAPTLARDKDAYRAFCLVALGRTAEAEAVAESLLRTDPTFSVDQYQDASPRIATLFTTVKKRVLPQLIRQEYRAARNVDANRADVESHLTNARRLLDDAQQIGASDDALGDLRMLVDGFLELSRARPSAAADGDSESTKAQTTPAPEAAAPPAEFDAASAGVVPPAIVSQTLPRVPPALVDLLKRLHGREIIEVVIDERGHVDDVRILQSMNAAYDALIVSAARGWKYKAATKDGQPVRFVKTMVVNIDAQ
jgi:TonB family protein